MKNVRVSIAIDYNNCLGKINFVRFPGVIWDPGEGGICTWELAQTMHGNPRFWHGSGPLKIGLKPVEFSAPVW
jgi:hypothetical protein